MEKEELKSRVADNIAFYRKRAGLTQLELAEKLNYSDKAISKWERGDGLPDLVVLNEMANIFGININDFTLNNYYFNNFFSFNMCFNIINIFC